MVWPTTAAATAVKGGGIFVSFCRSVADSRRASFVPIARSMSHLRITSTTKSERAGVFRLGPSFCKASTEAEVSSPPPPPPEATASGAVSAPLSVEEAAQKVKEAAEMLDIRVGRIVKAWRHEEADSLYVEEVDVGEEEPRIICSGLVKYVPLDYLQDKTVVVLANLKPRNMRGVKSCGMLLCASDASHENVELLVPPEGSLPGERIWFGSEDDKENQPSAATPNQVSKKRIWEAVQPSLKIDDSCNAMLGSHSMRTSAGLVVSSSLRNAIIS